MITSHFLTFPKTANEFSPSKSPLDLADTIVKVIYVALVLVNMAILLHSCCSYTFSALKNRFWKNPTPDTYRITHIGKIPLNPPIVCSPPPCKVPAFVQHSKFNLPASYRLEEKKSLANGAKILKEIDQIIGTKVKKRWNISQGEFDNLKPFAKDYKKYEAQADLLDNALEPYLGHSMGSLTSSNGLFERINEILDSIYARIAEKTYFDGHLDQCLPVALKIKNQSIREAILLAIASAYMKKCSLDIFSKDQNKIDEIEWIINKVEPCQEKDRLCFDWLNQNLSDKKNCPKIILILNKISFFDDKLKDFLFAKCAVNDFTEGWPKITTLLLNNITDIDLRDRLIFEFGKKLYAEKKYQKTLDLLQNLSSSYPTKDQLIQKVNKGQPI